jgi:hypothetical protein
MMATLFSFRRLMCYKKSKLQHYTLLCYWWPLLSFNIKKDGDAVTIFTETAIQTKQDIRLTQGGMLLMALLGGGDYDMASRCALILCLPW